VQYETYLDTHSTWHNSRCSHS